MLVFPQNAEKNASIIEKGRPPAPNNSALVVLMPVHASVACKPRGDLPIDLCGCNRALVHRFIIADDVNNVENSLVCCSF